MVRYRWQWQHPAQCYVHSQLFHKLRCPRQAEIASGRGLTALDCRRSALGEAVELVSCCDWGDRQLIRASQVDIGAAALSPEALNGFAKEQLNSREEWNQIHAGFDWRPAPQDRRAQIDWMAVEDAYGGPGRFAPADFVMIGRREPGDENAVAIGDSNGCAAGVSAEAAKTAALLELVERTERADGGTDVGAGRRSTSKQSSMPLMFGTGSGRGRVEPGCSISRLTSGSQC